MTEIPDHKLVLSLTRQHAERWLARAVDRYDRAGDAQSSSFARDVRDEMLRELGGEVDAPEAAPGWHLCCPVGNGWHRVVAAGRPVAPLAEVLAASPAAVGDLVLAMAGDILRGEALPDGLAAIRHANVVAIRRAAPAPMLVGVGREPRPEKLAGLALVDGEERVVAVSEPRLTVLVQGGNGEVREVPAEYLSQHFRVAADGVGWEDLQRIEFVAPVEATPGRGIEHLVRCIRAIPVVPVEAGWSIKPPSGDGAMPDGMRLWHVFGPDARVGFSVWAPGEDASSNVFDFAGLRPSCAVRLESLKTRAGEPGPEPTWRDRLLDLSHADRTLLEAAIADALLWARRGGGK